MRIPKPRALLKTPEVSQYTRAVTILIPVAKEDSELRERVTALKRNIEGTPLQSSEIILASDANDSETLLELRRLSDTHLCRSYMLTSRTGKGGTIKNMMILTSTPINVVIDSDIPIKVEDIMKATTLIAEGKADIVIGVRTSRPDGVKRRTLSVGYNCLVRLLFRTGIRDHQAGFKVISKDAFNSVQKFLRTDGLGFDTELIVWSKKTGLGLHTFPVHWKPTRTLGGSSIVPLRATISMLLDVLVLRLITNLNVMSWLRIHRIGDITDMIGNKVGEERMTTLFSTRNPLVCMLRKFYLILSFGGSGISPHRRPSQNGTNRPPSGPVAKPFLNALDLDVAPIKPTD